MSMIEPNKTRFGIYVHWPFCAAKCPYCDFNSHVRHKPVDQDIFVEAYEREIEYFGKMTGKREIDSVFFGGGTPSLMAPKTAERILAAIARTWNIRQDAEITLEANPTSTEAEKFRGFAAAGINRISVGVQSFDDKYLKFLGRQHDAAEARRAVEIAENIFPRMSFDMIYCRPGQTAEQWANELQQAMEHAADHLSLYQLTIEQGTPFYSLHTTGKLKLPDSELAADLYDLTFELTASNGIPAYEISNYARQGAESRHNLIYWRYADYVGIGPGAHGRITIDGKRLATATVKHPETWWQQAMTGGHGLETEDVLSRQEMADEFLVMGLRLAEGIDPGRYAELAGTPLNPARIAPLVEEGFLRQIGKGSLAATPKGFMVLDAVVADIAA